MRRKTLTDRQKIYVVKGLAAYDPLVMIVRGLKEEFGITVQAPTLRYYNPENRHPTLAQRWKDLFWRTRRSYIDGTVDIGASHKPVRIRWRGKFAEAAWNAEQYKVANAILDSIAKEIGDAPDETQSRGHFGLRGGPLTATVNIVRRAEPAPDEAPADSARDPREVGARRKQR